MQIRIIKNENGSDEWMLMEMQGDVNNGGRPFNGELFCNIAWRKDNSEALMLVGHHLLEGKVTKLEKPYIVVAPDDRDGKKILYAEAIVKRKLVFKLRPKPIVTKLLMKRAQLDKMKDDEHEKEMEEE